MTHAEKLSIVQDEVTTNQTTGYRVPRGGAGWVPGISRLGIPALYLADGRVGVGNLVGPATALPSSHANAASWDLTEAANYRAVIGLESRSGPTAGETIWGLQGYVHDRQVQSHQEEGEHLLVCFHRLIALLKRWLLGTLQGAIRPQHLDDYLDEFTFRFNRRTAKPRGKLFYRLAQQAMPVSPVLFATLVKTQPVVSGGVK